MDRWTTEANLVPIASGAPAVALHAGNDASTATMKTGRHRRTEINRIAIYMPTRCRSNKVQ